jgi:hypothetical protein
VAKFKLWFNNGGAIEFGQALMNAGRLASQVRQQQPANMPPPSYTPSQNIYAAPPPAYSGGSYGWVPLDRFPDRPPDNTVFCHDSPPPYCGIYPNAEQNAGYVSSGFYNPQNPTKVYATSSAPPPDVNNSTFFLN